MRDILTGEEYVVRERRGSETILRWEIVFMRLVPIDDHYWRDVETLIEKYKYRDATELLVRLYQVALHKGSEAEFRTRLDLLMERFKTRRTWIESIRNAGLNAQGPLNPIR